MKTHQSSVNISIISLLISLVCLAGLIHVEYKLYTNGQTQHVQTSNDAVTILLKESQKDFEKDVHQTGYRYRVRNRRDIQKVNKNQSFIPSYHIRELKEIVWNEFQKNLKVLKVVRGRRGRRGTTGPPGKIGPSGPRGKHGPIGPQGTQGPEGMKGEIGPIGPPGPHGPTGHKGPKGDSADPIAAPSILVPPKDLVVNVSDSVQLKCVAEGNPVAKVTWSKNNSSLPSGSHVVHGFLSIKQVASNDEGVYTCTARNVLGVAMASSFLTVQVPPVFTFKPKSAIAEENTIVTLDCGASGPPRPTISWTKIIGDLPKNRSTALSNDSLVIKDIRKTDGGIFICTAENLLGRVGTHAQITVLPALKFTRRPLSQLQSDLGVQVVLDCQATNALELEWLKDNKPLGASTIVHSNGTLVIPNPSPQDSGTYTCIARRNFHRSIKTTTQMTVTIKSCSELKKKLPRIPSGNYVIDPDGQSGLSKFTVYCDMTDKGGVGVTVVSHDSEVRTLVDGYKDSPGSYSKDVGYNGVSMAQLAKLTAISTHCEQFIMFECLNDVKFIDEGSGYGWWVSRDGVRQNYWGGAKPGSKKCACGMTNTCQIKSQGCNCENTSRGWRSDSGLLTDKSTLPVTQLRFGDTDQSSEQGYHTLGKLKCYG